MRCHLLTHCCSCTVQSAARAASSNVLYTPTYITWSPEEQRKGGGLAFELPPVLLPSTVGVALTIFGPYLPPLASFVHETVPVFQVRSFLGGACFVGSSALVHRRGCSFSFGGVVGVGGRGCGHLLNIAEFATDGLRKQPKKVCTEQELPHAPNEGPGGCETTKRSKWKKHI